MKTEYLDDRQLTGHAQPFVQSLAAAAAPPPAAAAAPPAMRRTV